MPTVLLMKVTSRDHSCCLETPTSRHQDSKTKTVLDDLHRTAFWWASYPMMTWFVLEQKQPKGHSLGKQPDISFPQPWKASYNWKQSILRTPSPKRPQVVDELLWNLFSAIILDIPRIIDQPICWLVEPGWFSWGRSLRNRFRASQEEELRSAHRNGEILSCCQSSIFMKPLWSFLLWKGIHQNLPESLWNLKRNDFHWPKRSLWETLTSRRIGSVEVRGWEPQLGEWCNRRGLKVRGIRKPQNIQKPNPVFVTDICFFSYMFYWKRKSEFLFAHMVVVGVLW